jgi:hypothetical protein
VLGTVAWTVIADRVRGHARAAYQHALAAGFDRAFLVAAAVAVLIVAVTVVMIRVRHADLAGG